MTSYAQNVWFVPKIAILSEKRITFRSLGGFLRHRFYFSILRAIVTISGS
jgi:hypothetical protein